MRMHWFLIVCLMVVFIAPMVSAAPPAQYPTGFSVPFNKTFGDNAVYNVSYRWNDNPTTHWQNLYFYATCAVILSVLGYRLRCEYCTVLAIIFSIMGTYAAQAVDFVYYGVASTVSTESTPDTYNYVSMALHEVTPMPNMMITMGIICILMIANLYLIYVWHRGSEVTQ